MTDDGLPTSRLRRLMTESQGHQTPIYLSWEEARNDPDAAVVISGDDGGTVYLTVPLRLVHCSAQAIAQFATELDATAWNDPTALEVTVEHLPVGSSVPGGMCGGLVVDDVWLHPHYFADNDARRAQQVLSARNATTQNAR
jgi:hypothetical protein